MAKIAIQYSQIVELIVPAANTNSRRFQFPDQPQLRDKTLVDALECFNVEDMAISPQGLPLMTADNMSKSFLTLFVKDLSKGNAVGGEYINQLPLVAFHRVQTSTNPFVRDMFGLGTLLVDWSKSYVTVPADLGIVAPTSFLFNIYYRFLDQKQK